MSNTVLEFRYYINGTPHKGISGKTIGWHGGGLEGWLEHILNHFTHFCIDPSKPNCWLGKCHNLDTYTFIWASELQAGMVLHLLKEVNKKRGTPVRLGKDPTGVRPR